MRQRTREGIETAKINGKQIGQTSGSKLTTKKSLHAQKMIQKYSKDFGGSLNDIECIRMTGISRGSYYKYKRELLLENTEKQKRGSD